MLKSIGSIDGEQKVWFKCPAHGGESYFSNTGSPKIVPIRCFCGHKYVVYVKENNPPSLEPDKVLKLHLLKLAKRRQIALKAAEFLNLVSEVEAAQNGKKLMESIGNKLVYNFLSLLATQIRQSSTGQTVSYIGQIWSPGVNSVNFQIQTRARTVYDSYVAAQLGTDTSTPTPRELWIIVSPINHTQPSASVSATIESKTYAGKTYNAVTAINMGHTYAAGWTTGSPTIGELILYLRSYSGTYLDQAVCVSRLSAADGEFTPFTADGSADLTVTWRWRYAD